MKFEFPGRAEDFRPMSNALTAIPKLALSDWSLRDAESGGALVIAILEALEADSGQVSSIEYRVDQGEAIALADGLTSGDRRIPAFGDKPVSVSLRLVGSGGEGDWCEAKSVTPTPLSVTLANDASDLISTIVPPVGQSWSTQSQPVVILIGATRISATLAPDGALVEDDAGAWAAAVLETGALNGEALGGSVQSLDQAIVLNISTTGACVAPRISVGLGAVVAGQSVGGPGDGADVEIGVTIIDGGVPEIGPADVTLALTSEGLAAPLPHIATEGEKLRAVAALSHATGDFDVSSAEVSVDAAPSAPIIIASSSLSERVVSIRIDSVTGHPAPDVALSALTLDGASVIDGVTGSGPWLYEAPSAASSHTVAWSVTATNSAGTEMASGSEVVAADLVAPGWSTLPTSSVAARTITVTTGAATGAPSPTYAITATLNGSPILMAGAGPWSYDVPSSATTSGFSATITASNGVGSDIAHAVAETVSADLLIPDAFTPAMWSLGDSPSAGGDALTLTISMLPGDGGSAITALQYQVDSGAGYGAAQTLSGTAPGARQITVLAGTAASVQVRAVNVMGAGAWSDVKAATPSVEAGDENLISGAPTTSGFINPFGDVDSWSGDPNTSAPWVSWAFDVVEGETYVFSGVIDAPTDDACLLTIATQQDGASASRKVVSPLLKAAGLQSHATEPYLATFTGTVYAVFRNGFSSAAGVVTLTGMTVTSDAVSKTAPSFTTAPGLSPASGPVGTEFTLSEGVASGSPAPTLTGVLTLDGVDVTPAGLTYISTAAGDLVWTVTATNAVSPDATGAASATVTSEAVETDVSFGALTRAGAGGVPAPSGATAISGGTATGYTLSGGMIAPTADGSADAGTLTFTGSAETMTIGVESSAYSFRDAAELAAAVAVGDAGGGFTLKGRGAEEIAWANWFDGKAYASRVVLTSHDPAAKQAFLVKPKAGGGGSLADVGNFSWTSCIIRSEINRRTQDYNATALTISGSLTGDVILEGNAFVSDLRSYGYGPGLRAVGLSGVGSSAAIRIRNNTLREFRQVIVTAGAKPGVIEITGNEITEFGLDGMQIGGAHFSTTISDNLIRQPYMSSYDRRMDNQKAYFARNSDFIGAVDGKKCAVFFCIRNMKSPLLYDVNDNEYYFTLGDRMELWRDVNSDVRFQARDTAGNVVVDLTSTSDFAFEGGAGLMLYILVSVDTDGSASMAIWDEDSQGWTVEATQTLGGGQTLDLTGGSVHVGRKANNTGLMEFAEFRRAAFWQGVAPDVTSSAVRDALVDLKDGHRMGVLGHETTAIGTPLYDYDFRSDFATVGGNRGTGGAMEKGGGFSRGHADAIQFTGSSTQDVVMERNRILAYRDDGEHSSGGIQGIFMGDDGKYRHARPRIVGNLIILPQSRTHAITVYGGVGARLIGNGTYMLSDLVTPNVDTVSPKYNIYSKDDMQATNAVIGDSVRLSSSADPNATSMLNGAVRENNWNPWPASDEATADPSLEARFTDAFEGLGGGAAADFTQSALGVPADVLTAFTPKAGTPGFTGPALVGPIGQVDYAARRYDIPRANAATFAGFSDVLNAPTSTLMETPAVAVTSVVRSDGAASTQGALVTLGYSSTAVDAQFRVLEADGVTVEHDWGTAPRVVTAGQRVALRQTSGDVFDVDHVAYLHVGDALHRWNLATVEPLATAPDAMLAPTVEGGPLRAEVTLAAEPALNLSALRRYDLRWSDDGGSSWTVIEDVNPDGPKISGLSPSTMIHVQTRAVNGAGEGAWSPSGFAATDPPKSAQHMASLYSTSAVASRTFPAVDLGDTGMVYVALTWRNSSSSVTMSSVTIGGVAATLVSTAIVSANSHNAQIWAATGVPSGAGDLVVVSSAATAFLTAEVYAVSGVRAPFAPVASAVATLTASPIELYMTTALPTTLPGGVLLACASVQGSTGYAFDGATQDVLRQTVSTSMAVASLTVPVPDDLDSFTDTNTLYPLEVKPLLPAATRAVAVVIQ